MIVDNDKILSQLKVEYNNSESIVIPAVSVSPAATNNTYCPVFILLLAEAVVTLDPAAIVPSVTSLATTPLKFAWLSAT